MKIKQLFQMKNILLTIFFIATQAYATMAIVQNSDIKNATDELTLIKQEKLAIDASLKKQETLCYKKFAVSSCLKEAKTEAQTALNKIKRREIEIKELQRSAKAESDINKKVKTFKKNTQNKSEEATVGEFIGKAKTVKAPKVSRPIKTDAEILAEKNAQDISRAEAAKKRVDNSNQKLAASQKKAQYRANKNSQSAANFAKYNQKLAQAEEHKQALEKEKLAKNKTKAAPLPIPATTTP
jgi:colicin import membrane protein